MLKSYSPYLATMNDDEIASILKAALTLYFESHPLENSEQRGYNISAVSYTHLDVYKRQL